MEQGGDGVCSRCLCVRITLNKSSCCPEGRFSDLERSDVENTVNEYKSLGEDERKEDLNTFLPGARGSSTGSATVGQGIPGLGPQHYIGKEDKYRLRNGLAWMSL